MVNVSLLIEASCLSELIVSTRCFYISCFVSTLIVHSGHAMSYHESASPAIYTWLDLSRLRLQKPQLYGLMICSSWDNWSDIVQHWAFRLRMNAWAPVPVTWSGEFVSYVGAEPVPSHGRLRWQIPEQAEHGPLFPGWPQTLCQKYECVDQMFCQMKSSRKPSLSHQHTTGESNMCTYRAWPWDEINSLQ